MEIRVEYAPEGLERPQLVGRLYEDAGGTIYFEYDEDWRARGLELSPLRLPLSTRGAVVNPTRSFGPLFGLFEDSLPDWWGERLMRRFFADLGIPWNRVTTLQKLACGGDRKMGALVYQPVVDSAAFGDRLAVDVESMVDAAQAAAAGEGGEILEQLIPSGLTPGGAQPKALLAFSEDFARVSAADPAPDGFVPWLLKFDVHPELHEGRIEYAYNLMAAEAGINVPEVRLLETHSGWRVHFMSRRFDRVAGSRRIHMHSFSGLVHVPPRDGFDYGDLMNLARMLTRDHRAVEEVFRRALFNVAAGNDDDHGRNHAFLMETDGAWQLSPAYDVTLASHPLTAGIRSASVRGKLRDIGRKDFLLMAEEHGVGRAGEIIDSVLAAVDRWPEIAERAGIPASVAADCRERMPGLPE